MRFSLAGIIREPAAGRERAALVYGERRITYAELDERSSLVADRLRRAGLEAGDRVGFIGKNCPEYFEILFGAAKLGLTAVAVNWRLSAQEVGFILDDSGAAVVFAEPEFETAARGAGGAERELIDLGADYDRWLADAEPLDPGLGGDPDDVVLQLYTSGTTGVPKGAMITNRNLGTVLEGLSTEWSFEDEPTSVVAMPLFHIGGAGYGLLGMLNGGTGLLYREFDPAAIVADLGRHRVTNALFVPAMLQALCDAAEQSHADCESMRSIVYGAAPISTVALERALSVFGCDFIGSYGITETCGPVSQLDAAEHSPEERPELLLSVGKAFPWVELEVVDVVTGDPLAAGQTGEVRIRSDQVMRGYWGRPEDSAAVIDADGWFRTGDAGRLDSEGHLFLTDRVKDMVITGGENVYPVEVENVLAASPDVSDVAVFGVPDERWGEAVKAAVVPVSREDFDPDELIAFARERLAAFKCPRSIDVMAEIPRNPTGKIVKRELRAPYWAGRERSI